MTRSARRTRMSSVDTAWLRMDRPNNLMMIVGVDVFDRPVEFAALRAVVQERLLAWDRFRQRVEFDDTGAAWWVDDDRFDLDVHLRETRLGGRGDAAALQQLTAELAVTPLDPDRPLWEFLLVRGYAGTDALVVRIHHCIADGIALIRVMLSLTDAAAPVPHSSEPPLHDDAEHGDAALASNPWKPYLEPITHGAVRAIEAAGEAIEVAGEAVAGSVELASHPQRLLHFAQAAPRVASDAARIAFMASDTRTSLKGQPAVAKAVAWNDPLPLADVKLVCRALRASVNDVLLACVAGGLRRYFRERGEDTDDCEIRAMVPVNLRPVAEPLSLGNRFGLAPVLLPVGIGNPVARLQEVRRRMDEMKHGYQAVLAFGLLGAAGLAPRAVQDPLLDYMAGKATAVMTNVPGPTAKLDFAGQPLRRMMFWVPQSGDIGLGMSILSYAGGVQFSVITSRRLCPEPQRLVDGFDQAFDELLTVVAMLPDEMLGHGAVDADALEHALFGESVP
jgi:diacylglycerol O-acyltransferase